MTAQPQTPWTAAEAYLKGIKDAEDEMTDSLKRPLADNSAKIAEIAAGVTRLRASHDTLLAAAKLAVERWPGVGDLEAFATMERAIANAERAP